LVFDLGRMRMKFCVACVRYWKLEHEKNIDHDKTKVATHNNAAFNRIWICFRASPVKGIHLLFFELLPVLDDINTNVYIDGVTRWCWFVLQTGESQSLPETSPSFSERTLL
jgi:hypothetical protein